MGLQSSSPPSFSAQKYSSTTASTNRSQSNNSFTMKVLRAIRRNLNGYLFLLPALIIFALFVWYPVILGFIISFQHVDMLSPATGAGWSNYRHVLTDPLFLIAWRNTFEFTVYALIFGYATPIVLALLLNEMRHGKGFFRLAFYLPVML
ncbi:MAG TPA: sugar ABC transporter permease, partial [Ktedonobacteraceae bacterium]